MSYSKFTKALNGFYEHQPANHVISMNLEDVSGLIRDAWIRNAKYKELIAYILENWDSGNCDDFSRPLSQHLIFINEAPLFIRLWQGIIANRLDKLWRDVDQLKRKDASFTIDKIKHIDVSTFNQFSASETIERKVAWKRIYAMEGIAEFIAGLKLLRQKEETERQTYLLGMVSNLENPVFLRKDR